MDLVKVIIDKRISLDILVVETDTPFMHIYPSTQLVPADTGYIVEEIARLKQIDLIDRMWSTNIRKFYKDVKKVIIYFPIIKIC